MNIDAIITETKRLCDDDQSIANADIQSWIDLAINRINQALKVNIPTISALPTTTVPSFDARYHEVLILFCIIKYREGDSDYTAAQYFQQQFNEMLSIMQRDMTIPPSLRMDESIQQIVVTDATVSVYTLTIPYGSYYSNLVVYWNDAIVDSRYYTIDQYDKTISFDVANIIFVVNDKISIDYELNAITNQPPLDWWGNMGW